jgi:hypothetical protein
MMNPSGAPSAAAMDDMAARCVEMMSAMHAMANMMGEIGEEGP